MLRDVEFWARITKDMRKLGFTQLRVDRQGHIATCKLRDECNQSLENGFGERCNHRSWRGAMGIQALKVMRAKCRQRSVVDLHIAHTERWGSERQRETRQERIHPCIDLTRRDRDCRSYHIDMRDIVLLVDV